MFKIIFLRNLFLKRVKHLVKKNLFINYYFYRSMLNFFNFKKKQYLNKLYLNKFLEKTPIYPEFVITKNIFNKKNKALLLLKKNNLEFFFLKNVFNKDNFGLSYYILLNDNNYKNLIKDLADEDNFNLIHFKNELNFELSLSGEINFFFNFNLNILCNLEIYKIVMLLYLYNVIKN